MLAGERTGADAHWGPSDNLACSSGVRVIWKRVREAGTTLAHHHHTPASPELLLRIQAERKKTKQNKNLTSAKKKPNIKSLLRMSS